VVEVQFPAPGSPNVAILSATPQHSSRNMEFGVAGPLRMNLRCATKPPARFACVADMLRKIRHAPGLVPIGIRQLLRMLRQISGG
jgi:hypothetical protein